jgi:hypothetical protein
MRQHAIECLEMADRAVLPDRSGLLELAEVWFKLAMEAAESDRHPGVSTKLH